jgi:putative peptidoglycan lipid II flippase
MVGRLISFLNREVNGIHQAAFLLAVFAILSQVLGLFRDRLLAGVFGAGSELDLYYAAFRIPDFLFVTVGSLVSVSVLIPFLAERLSNDVGEGRRFLDSVFSFFLILIVCLGIIVFALVPFILSFVFPGFPESSKETLVTLTRIMLLSPILLGVSGLYSSIVQTHSRFFIYALGPLLYNLGIIIGIMVFAPTFGLPGLAFGVVLGALMHLLIQTPFVIKVKLIPRLVAPNWRLIKKIVPISIPRTLSLSFQHIAILVLLAAASLMTIGSISIFSLSFNLQSVPLSIIGVSYSLAAFPTLSRLYSSGEKQKFIDQIITSARHVVFWSVPFTVIFVVLRAHIVRTILGSGQFDWTDTRLAAATVALFSFSLVFQGLILLFTRGFYAMGKTRVPFIAGLSGALTIILSSWILNFVFVKSQLFRYFIETLFKVSDIPGTEMLMLPLGFSIGACVNAIILWRIFKRQFDTFPKSISITLFQSISASVIMGAVIFVCLRFLNQFISLDTFFGVLAQGVLSGIVGITAGILMLRALKNREINEIWRTLHQKFWKAKVIGPDPEIV